VGIPNFFNFLAKIPEEVTLRAKKKKILNFERILTEL